MPGVLVSKESTESRGTHAFCWTRRGGGAWSSALGTPRGRGAGPWAHHAGAALGLGHTMRERRWAVGTPRGRGAGPWAHHAGAALGLGCGARGLPVPHGLFHPVRELLVAVSGLHCPGDLSSQTRDGTCIPCLARWILNHWTAREALD